MFWGENPVFWDKNPVFGGENPVFWQVISCANCPRNWRIPIAGVSRNRFMRALVGYRVHVPRQARTAVEQKQIMREQS